MFTVGRLPDEEGPLKRAQEIVVQLRVAPSGRRMPHSAAAAARLLPSGDTWFLLHGADRELLVPNERQRRAPWTSRVWPGALLVEGEAVGTWRRAEHILTLQRWRRCSRAQREAVEAEAGSLPLPGINRPMDIRWDSG
ncbi:MAG: DNA glycosylase AlkZ-like family protein [Anaerolineales bacterium]